MKSFLLALTLLLALPLNDMHAEEKEKEKPETKADGTAAVYQYNGKITGLYCSACADKVKASLKKMDGVSKIKITSSKEQGVQNIILESTSQSLTAEKAIKALGEDAKSFNVLSLEKTDEK